MHGAYNRAARVLRCCTENRFFPLLYTKGPLNPLFDSGPLNLSRPGHFIFTFKSFMCVRDGRRRKRRKEHRDLVPRCRHGTHKELIMRSRSSSNTVAFTARMASDLHNLSHRVNSLALQKCTALLSRIGSVYYPAATEFRHLTAHKVYRSYSN
jgi:hypothetical protein